MLTHSGVKYILISRFCLLPAVMYSLSSLDLITAHAQDLFFPQRGQHDPCGLEDDCFVCGIPSSSAFYCGTGVTIDAVKLLLHGAL